MMMVSVLGKSKGGAQTLKTVPLEQLVEDFKTESRPQYVSMFREACLSNWGHPEWFDYLDRIPRVCPAAEWQLTAAGEQAFVAYTGLVLLEVDGLANRLEVETVKHEAALQPQTVLAVAGCSGRSVKVLVAASLPGGGLPQERQQAEMFHAAVYQKAVRCYAPMLSQPVRIVPPRLELTFRWTLDPKPYYNPEAQPIVIDQPESMPSEALQMGERLPLRVAADEALYTYGVLFSSAYRQALRDVEGWTFDAQPDAMYVAVAKRCVQAGLPEEEVVYRLSAYFMDHDIVPLRLAVRSVYESVQGVPSVNMPKKQEAAIRLRDFFSRRYDVRYNEILGLTEYRRKRSISFMFKPLGKRDLNTIRHEAALEGIEAFDSEVRGLLESNYVACYNPVEDYLHHVGAWDGHDHIGRLAALVPCSLPEWPQLFRRWFLSMVAHWLQYDRLHGNNTAPVLIGPQGYRKSTFCRLILPPDLSDYYTDSVDFRTDADAERYLGRFLLINVDEFDRLNDRQFTFLKHLFQKPVAQLRRSYSQAIEAQRRYASFMGTSNQHEVLRDPTGNRRYICVEVTAPIRTDQPVNHRQLYAQAMHALTHGERYWLDDADEAVITSSNRAFEQQDELETLFTEYFRRPESPAEGCLLTPTQILDHLRRKPGFTRNMDSTRRLGRTLIHLGYTMLRKGGLRYYAVVLKTTA